MSSEHTHPSGSAAHMLATHADIDRLLGALRDAAEADARPGLDQAWDALERALLAHLEDEETYLFPALAARDPSEQRALLREHADIRHDLAEIGMDVELHTARLETLDQLAARLRAHAAREDGMLYRWIDTASERGPRALARRMERRGRAA